MPWIRLLLLPLLLAGTLPTQEAPPALGAAEYEGRRARLLERLPGGAVVIEAGRLVPGAAGIEANTAVYDFTYLAGLHDDRGVLVLVPGEKEPLLFAGDPDAARKASGLSRVLPRDRFEAFAAEVLSGAKVLYVKASPDFRDALRAAVPGPEIRKDVGPVLARLRAVKSDAEAALMRKAADATSRAHRDAMKACAAGMNEGALQKVIEEAFRAEGCEGPAFPPIVGGGPNGTVLHYMRNADPIPADSLVVCDIGASFRGYASDVTRTLPTSGRFTDVQRKAYQCVLDAQRAAEEALRPGATFGTLERAARKVFVDRGMTDWSYAHSREPSVRHGLGHFVGLSVHDSGPMNAPFEPGMVITIEPGYYSKKDGWGIRIEDIYLVTKDGFERLSSAPREIDEIEKAMADR